MDPAIGRRWIRRERLASDLYVHTMPVPADAASEWLSSDDFQRPLRRRLRAIGCENEAARMDDLAALDAATRYTASLADTGALSPGAECAATLAIAYDLARNEGEKAIPSAFWTITPASPSEDGERRVQMRGAVLVTVAGLRDRANDEGVLSPELVRALEEPPPKPLREILRYVGGDGASGAALRAAIVVAAIGAAIGGVLEAVLLRGVFDIGHELGVVQERLGAMGALVLFLLLLLGIEAPAGWSFARLGRRLETRVRVAFLQKIPRMGDRYFASRPVSDMAERCHAGTRVRAVPDLAAQALRIVMELVVTVVGLAWLDPTGAPWAALAAVAAVAAPLAFLPSLSERDLKIRTHEGALARFYLDALLGMSPIRTHGAERSVAREHESLLVEWARAARSAVRTWVAADLIQSIVGTAVAVLLLSRHLRGSGDPASVILLVYWSLALPALGQELGALLRQLPGHRNTMLRVLEPLGAMEEHEHEHTPPAPRNAPVAITFESASVVAAGHTLLEDVQVAIERGEHVAIVGASGAGKSSLLALLLGWHRPSAGRVLVDGIPLDATTLSALRESTAWVDPAVHVWNRSLVENLLYGGPADAPSRLGAAIDAAELANVLEKLPDGMQTALGESGGLVSGGEGQRVRLARAMLRQDARLVLLDEPFRGLDRERRHALLERARVWWKGATLLCITHDVGETTSFGRVLVVEDGRVVEDGAPSDLLEHDTRYRAMITAEREVMRDVWEKASWRRVDIERGRIVEAGRSDAFGSRRIERGTA
jgi:ATP-binding cassette subfamily B protein